jgi:hypothetical protein
LVGGAAAATATAEEAATATAAAAGKLGSALPAEGELARRCGRFA